MELSKLCIFELSSTTSSLQEGNSKTPENKLSRQIVSTTVVEGQCQGKDRLFVEGLGSDDLDRTHDA
jgi:hypothetical protein